MTLGHVLSAVDARPGDDALRDVAPPMVLLRESALERNLTLMAEYCRSSGVDLAPHGKTSMSPQLIRRQLDAGAWGITAATAAQARLIREMGVHRILIANQVLDKPALHWLATEGSGIYCLVDSEAAVRLMDNGLAAAGFRGHLRVLVELGLAGGRTGCRTRDQAQAVARAVLTSRHLALGGVEGYEGVVENSQRAVPPVDSFLRDLRRLAEDLDTEGAFRDLDEIIVTAGGSVFFDRVTEQLEGLDLSRPVRIILRSGCYVAHDDGNYASTGPFGTRLHDQGLFAAALEAWGMVVSRPEPELAIVGFGKRNVSFDWAMPHPVAVSREGRRPEPLEGAEIFRLHDHHAYVRLYDEAALSVGDLMGCTLSHPCTVFDKWRRLPIVDDDYRVVSIAETCF